jgi:tetratricopeptide (TPR) repeat protein
MIKYLCSKLSLITTIAIVSFPLLATADINPNQSEPEQQTIASLNIALQQNPQDIDAYVERGILYAKLNQNLTAISDYTEAIRLDPNRALAYNNRAVAKLNLRDYRGAYLDYTQVVRILPDKAITYNNRATARQGMGDCKGAIADLKIAAALFQLQGDSFNYQRTLANLQVFQKSKR